MLETIAVILIIAAAVSYLVSVFYRAAKGRAGCGAGCGCSASPRLEDNLGKRYDLISLGSGPKNVKS
ncbi:MAG TPA: FeoB-associated Cys-rich membrane protein [Phycisphaerae bacterium]|nr:FeoB-associated Cys-rich membrane protein [Phycisphaerae bacterium]